VNYPIVPEGDALASVRIGASPPMQRLRDVICKVAASRLPVLIMGPTGWGKDTVRTPLADAPEPVSTSPISRVHRPSDAALLLMIGPAVILSRRNLMRMPAVCRNKVLRLRRYWDSKVSF